MRRERIVKSVNLKIIIAMQTSENSSLNIQIHWIRLPLLFNWLVHAFL